MKIDVLGPGCPRCHKALEAVQQAVAELGVAAEVAYVTDLKEIMKAGVIVTPAVILDGEIKLMGQVPTVAEVKKILQAAR